MKATSARSTQAACSGSSRRSDGYRLLVWDPRENRHVYIGSEAVGPAESPFWSAFADDGKWLDVTLTPPQHIKAMQGDELKLRDLVTAGLQGDNQAGLLPHSAARLQRDDGQPDRPGFDGHLPAEGRDVHPVLHGDGAAIHYNWWGPPRGFGNPGSHGCLGMRWDGSKFLWDWANIGTPIVIHQ